MSFWTGVKRAFGFSPDDEDYDEQPDDDYSSAPSAEASPGREHEETEKPEPAVAEEEPETTAHPAGDPTLPADLFDAILEVFNSAQPDFIRQCLSTEAQRAFLLNALSEKLRSRLSKAVGTEAMAADEALRQECGRLTTRISELESQLTEIASVREQNTSLKLSLKNQKRALQNRIRDLETRAEATSGGQALAKAEARIIEMEAEISALRTSQPSQHDAESENSQAIVNSLGRELQRQTMLREQAEMKSRMADQMVTDMRNRAAAARADLEQNQAEQEEAMTMIQQQLDDFAELKKRLETRINELQEALKEERRDDREARITKLNEENASLRHTIENNLYNQANSEMRLRKEIKELRRQLEAAAATPTAGEMASANAGETSESKPAPRRRGRPKKTRIDPELNDTGWFTAPEPEPQSKGTAAKEDPEFGYHEPSRRPSNDNAAQLTLF